MKCFSKVMSLKVKWLHYYITSMELSFECGFCLFDFVLFFALSDLHIMHVLK